MKAIKALLLCYLLVGTLQSAPVNIIYDDDCQGDEDAALLTLPAIFKLMDQGALNVIGMVADSANSFSAPVMKIFATYYGRPGMTIGAYQGANLPCSNGCNGSVWTGPLVTQYNPGDTRSNYPDCVTTYRTLLSTQSAASVAIVETGFMTCLNGLLQSPADGISSLTGAQMMQQKVSFFVIMGGVNPSGTEFNFQSDPSDTSAFFSTVTSQNGYPPVYGIAVGNGTGTNAGPPTYAVTTVNPARFVQNQSSTNQRPIWDGLAVLYAARGLSSGGTTYFSDGGNGTQTVNASTGANAWSTGTASGQHYLNNVASTTILSNIFDGFAYGFGFSALPPGVSTGAYVQGGVKVNGGVTLK